MIDRRRLLLAAAATAAPPLVQAQVPNGDGARFHALLDAFLHRDLERQPALATTLGLDTGKLAGLRRRLGDRSLAQIARDEAETRRRLSELARVDRSKLQGGDPIYYDTLVYGLTVQAEASGLFDYARGQPGAPYVISQLTGAYQSVPDFLDSQHPIESGDDAEAYLARLAAFAVVLDQDSAQARRDAGLGVIPPDFALDKAMLQLRPLLEGATDQAVLVQSIARRTAEKGLAGDWKGRAARIWDAEVRPAVARQVALLRDLRARATHDAGVWRLPRGEDYYRLSLKSQTTTNLTAADIHRMGLEQVANYSGQIDSILKAQGMTVGTVGERLSGLFKDPGFLRPNTDAAKAELIADLNARMKALNARLPEAFRTLPKSGVDIRRVPAAIEAGVNGGYYQNGSLDGTRPGAFYINLRDTAEVPTWTLTTLTVHEAVPGHHLQQALAREADAPTLIKITDFGAYNEGWALYSEELAVEMGVYENDPFGHIGMLHDALLRAVRLVVDTGLHDLRWSREKAMRYYMDALGDPEATAASAIERYAVWPGQACSYMVGKLKILELRAKARAALGDRFDLKAFHDAVLLSGSMPLDVLDTLVDRWIARGGT